MNSNWAYLPAELFGLVLARLPVVAPARSAAVCKSWYALTADAVAAHKPEAPWIWRQGSSYFYSISEDRYYNLDLSGLDKKLCIGAHEDWLVIASPKGFITLYNPFSKARIELPLLSGGGGLYKMVFSSSPDQDPNCEVAVVSLINELPVVVGFCRVHENESNWNYINTGSRFADIVFYNRSLLGVTMEGELKSVNLDSLTVNLLLQAPPEQPIPSIYVTRRLGYRNLSEASLKPRDYRLIVSDGELLMLCSFRETPLALFKPNWELGQWKRTDSLKGKAIFLAENWFCSLGPALPNGVEEDTINFFRAFSGPDMFRLQDRMCFWYSLEKVFPKIWDKGFNYSIDQDFMLTPKLHFRRFFGNQQEMPDDVQN